MAPAAALTPNRPILSELNPGGGAPDVGLRLLDVTVPHPDGDLARDASTPSRSTVDVAAPRPAHQGNSAAVGGIKAFCRAEPRQKRQRDRRRREWKSLVHGEAIDGTAMVVVARIGPTRRLVILTVSLVEGEAR